MVSLLPRIDIIFEQLAAATWVDLIQLQIYPFIRTKDDTFIVSVFSGFGESTEITSEVSSLLLKYAILLYLKRQEDKVRYAGLVDIGKLRWKLYTKMRMTRSRPQMQRYNSTRCGLSMLPLSSRSHSSCSLLVFLW